MKIVDISSGHAVAECDDHDVAMLLTALGEAMALIENDGEYTERVGYQERIGYAEHSLDYLHTWLVAHRPNPGRQPFAAHAATQLPSADPTDQLLATCISGGAQDTTVRVSFTVDALTILDGSLREMLDHYRSDDPPFWEFTTITGYEPDDFHDIIHQVHHTLTDIHAAPP